ncbi:hypothetical protein BJ322DRAFT_1047256 [Thelephora terrestris]|uniref:Uncharacterized protein n=1 Tax=Thelephora terrestris TaxID=56493 RepID=A0A9P6HJJ4_9AGAM|nr:hypothetical protein BJ322DRAFT_1047256 [Thelephora terrestris]
MTTAANTAFLTVPNLLTCSAVTIEWTYNGTTTPASNYPLVVSNIGVSQSGPSRRGYPLAARQSTAVVNVTLAEINVSTGNFTWPKVNIPQGWYRMDIYAPEGVIPSNTFNVTNGLDFSCVVAPPQSSISPSSSVSTTTSSHSSPLSPATSPTNTSTVLAADNSSVRRRTIAGGVIGGVAILLLIAAVALLLSRRRKTRTRGTIPPATFARSKGQPSRANHEPSDSTGAILPFDGGSKDNSRQLSTSDEDFASEKSAVTDHDTMPKLPSIAVTRSRSTTSQRPASMIVKPSFESYESAQSRPSTSPPHSRYPPDRSRRASRKPVPVYNPSEFPNSETNDMPPSCPPETALGGSKVYYLIPDAPLEQRK